MDRMSVDELLGRHAVDPSHLELAPPEVTRRQVSARLREPTVRPCTVCGDGYRTAQVFTFPGEGPRWVDLCRELAIATMEPWRGPSTVEGILADLREVAAELAGETGASARVRTWTDEEGWRDERRT
ncbi:hypothetical protein AB0D11_44060 [Streptomyces monashensis]|uniref:hypothetical protein n=1 Tax=Streptomyces monashensis TaxID=1678012 RepID=UPI0033FCB313